MNHEDVKKNLADYLEGDLALDDRAVVDAHLDTCEECALEVLELEQTISLLRSLPEPETPPMMAANVMRRIRAGETEPGFFERLRRGLFGVLEPSFMLPASAIAAAALVVVVIQDPGRFGLGDSPSPSPSRSPMPTPLASTQAARPLTAMTPLTPVAVPRGGTDPAPAAARARARDRGQLFEVAHPSDRPAGVFAAAPPPNFLPGSMPGMHSMTGTGTHAPISARNQALPVAAPLPPGALVLSGGSGGAGANRVLHAGGEDPRDAWIALGLERPADLARFLAGKTLAEQELWVGRLADRAEARGLLDELVQALETTPDETAALLANDFSAEAVSLRAEAR